ncbi:MAG: nuclear transport factor 2 family protein [Actinomycetota bacterium]
MTDQAEANRALIARFYEALDRGDGATMAASYAADARFEDPAFGELSGEEAGAMWRMLTSRAGDLQVELAEHTADAERGSARWIARYTFTATGRPVVNDIRATFRFAEGRIVEHVDRFSFHKWSRQALGPAGLVLGLPLLRRLPRSRFRAELNRFRARENRGNA